MNGLLRPYTGSRIFEGTVGSTGISIATIARARYVLLTPFITHFEPANLGATTLVRLSCSFTVYIYTELVSFSDYYPRRCRRGEGQGIVGPRSRGGEGTSC
jgi:hypothetical protein